jgi:NADPH-dependent 2,4-dienoyl-CoA reductase/sulfur reductase-like enzyme
MPFTLLKYGLKRDYVPRREIPPTPELKPGYDVVIVGGGPAGLRRRWKRRMPGARVLVVDENLELGGSSTYAGFDEEPAAAAALLALARMLPDLLAFEASIT